MSRQADADTLRAEMDRLRLRLRREIIHVESGGAPLLGLDMEKARVICDVELFQNVAKVA